MNQRILELARQVWPDPNTSHVNHEKFAELIVRECADIAKNWEYRLGNAKCLKESNAVGIVAYQISRQFGVEE